jgi:hypothetical protein
MQASSKIVTINLQENVVKPNYLTRVRLFFLLSSQQQSLSKVSARVYILTRYQATSLLEQQRASPYKPLYRFTDFTVAFRKIFLQKARIMND